MIDRDPECKATCPMDLTLFPMDSQLCTLEVESYGYTMSDLGRSRPVSTICLQCRHLQFTSGKTRARSRSTPRCRWRSSTWWATGSGVCWRASAPATTRGCAWTSWSPGPWGTTSFRCYLVLPIVLPSATYTTCPWPGVRAQQPDRGDVLGELLPGPQLGPRQDRAGRHHRAHHGHPHELRQQVPRADVDDLYNDSSNLHLPQLSAKDLVHEVPGCVPWGVLPPGVRRLAGVRHGQLQRQEDQTQHAAVGGDTAPAAGGPGQVVELQTNPRVI